MNLLVLGGTQFVGRHLVAQALERGHTVTLFHRGRTNPELFPEAEHVLGDRDGGLDTLAGRNWDAVVDTCGYVPRLVRDAAKALHSAAPFYAFVSTISVYAEPGGEGEGPNEDSPLGVLEDETTETVDGATYGPLKALCEAEVRNVYGDAALIVRPGLIVGPHDPTGRFTWWPARAARGGRFVAPDAPATPTQFIDARDLTAWLLDMIERRVGGTYNATGPVPPATLGDVVAAGVAAAGTDAEPVWLPEETLLAAEVRPFMELPLWVTREGRGLMNVDVSRAVAQGLHFRSVSETVADTLAWWRALPEDARPGEGRAGIAAEKEAALLAAADARDGLR